MAQWLERYRGILVLILIAIILVGLVLFLGLRPSTAPPILSVLTPAPSPEPTFTPMPIRIYVSGAVGHPDVYTLPPDSIVKDAIQAAGGATDAADLERINLASPLTDGQQVHVPRVDEPNPTIPSLSQPAVSARVNINTASVPELDSLPGIGPATAQHIVEYRQAHGPFAKIEDIMGVLGIGQATFEKIRQLITTN